MAVLGLALVGGNWPNSSPAEATSRLSDDPPPAPLNKEELAFLLGKSGLDQGQPDLLKVEAGPGQAFLIETSLDPKFQRYLNQRIRSAGAVMVAVAALDAKTGQVKALASWDRLPGKTNYALTPAFPAASVFKMVTAAAAMERGGLTPNSKIPFHGRSHTLYKGQLKIPEPNPTRKPTLTESFARSFNPVFGKLANQPVAPQTLEQFARRFGFNQAIRFELPVSPSRVRVPRDDTFGLAAIGCGFNRETTLSPIHGALMAAAVVNRGLMMEPSIVQRVTVLQDGQVGPEVYRSQPQVLRRSLTPQTAARMRRLMAATITKGTSRRTFRRASRDRVLKHLLLGGKTGSINDSSQRYRIDWFVGYGQDKRTGQTLSLGLVVAHDIKRRGTSSRVLARKALRYYFDPRARKVVQPKPKAKPKQTKTRVIEKKPSSKSSG
ncbi:MAG: hypothetical protein JRJ59_10525 [Deltaproteobacteria bacterium]|nr:hypothetical protein [Deltaproteobacteria bacterium]